MNELSLFAHTFFIVVFYRAVIESANQYDTDIYADVVLISFVLFQTTKKPCFIICVIVIGNIKIFYTLQYYPII